MSERFRGNHEHLTRMNPTAYSNSGGTIFMSEFGGGDNIRQFPGRFRMESTEGTPNFNMPESREELLRGVEEALGMSLAEAQRNLTSDRNIHEEYSEGARAIEENIREALGTPHLPENMTSLDDWRRQNLHAGNVDEARAHRAIREVGIAEPADFLAHARVIQEHERKGAGKYGQFQEMLDRLDEMDGEEDDPPIEGFTHEERRRMRDRVDRAMRNPNAPLSILRDANNALFMLASEDPEAYADELSDMTMRLRIAEQREEAIRYLEQQGHRRNEITEDMIDMVTEQLRPATTRPQIIENLRVKITETDNLATAKDNFAWLQRYVREIKDSIDSGSLVVKDSTRDLINEAAGVSDGDLDSLENLKRLTERLTSDSGDGVNIKKFFTKVSRQEGRSRLMIQSLEELVEFISQSQGGEFSPGKKYAVINERGEVQLHNLVAWIRNRIVASHNTDPDEKINLFSMISVPASYRQISLQEMLYVPAYFQKRKTIIEGNEETGRIEMSEENVEDSEYNQFKEDLLYETWLFNVSHDNNAEYVSAREREDEIFNVLARQYAKSQFTKGRDRFLNILRLAKTDPDELNEALRHEKQGSVGKAISRSLLAYYFMSELAVDDCQEGQESNCIPRGNNMFKKTMGEGGMRYLYQSMIQQLLRAEYGNAINDRFPTIGKTELEEESDSVKLALSSGRRGELLSILKPEHGITAEDLARYDSSDPNQLEALALKMLSNLWGYKKGDLNIFNEVDKPDRLTSLVSNAITDATGKVENLNSDDAAYAGLWAFTMRNWTGIAAKNDTNGIGFDAWSKLINFGDYRMRQAQGREGAGNMETLLGIRSLGLSFVDGLMVTTESGETKSLIKVIQEGVLTRDEIESFDVKGNAQRQFAGNHVIRGYQLLQFILDKQELKMESFLSKDSRGYLVFDHVKAQELMGGPYKYMRYAFDQLGFPMEDTIHGWWKEYSTDPKTGKLKSVMKYGERKIKDHFFSKDVHDMDMYHDDFYKRDRERGRMAKNVFAYLLANEIKVHRQWGSTYPRWSIETIEEIEHFFARFPQEPGISVGKDGRPQPIVSRSFFTAHEWDQILKAFNSPYWKMYLNEYILQASMGFGGAFLKGFQELIKQTVSLPKAA